MEKNGFLPSRQSKNRKGGGKGGLQQQCEKERERDCKGAKNWRVGGGRRFSFSNLI